MFNLFSQHDPRFAMASATSVDGILYATVELPALYDNTPEIDAFHAAFGDLGGILTQGVTKVLAQNIVRHLKARSKSGKPWWFARCWRGSSPQRSPLWLMYAAVFATDDFVEVCTAGLTRVHLVSQGILQQRSHAHIVKEDPEAFDALTDLLLRADAGLSRESAQDSAGGPGWGSMLSRCLGTTTISGLVLGPEYACWSIQPPYQVIICSETWHGFNKDNEYLERLKTPHLLDESWGLVAVINVREPSEDIR